MGKVLLVIGLAGLCHAAYSATQHRNYMRLTEHDLDDDTKRGATAFTTLPLDILLQTIVSLLLSCYGIIAVSAKFRPIKITSEWENKTWDNISNRSSFYSFNHRGRFLFSNEIIKSPVTELSAAEKDALLKNYRMSSIKSKKADSAVTAGPSSSSKPAANESSSETDANSSGSEVENDAGNYSDSFSDEPEHSK